MSTYRDHPKLPKPVVVVMKRTLASIVITIATFGFMSIFVLVIFSQSTLDCSRSAGTCRITVRHGPGIITRDRTIPLRSIERATVEKHVDSDGDELEGIALVIDGHADTFDGSSNVGHDGKVQWTETVNAFLRDPFTDHLELQRGTLWPAYLWAILGVTVIILVLRARTVFTVNKVEGVLKVVDRGIGTTTTLFDLAEVASVSIHEKPSDETTVRAIVVQRKDGSSKAVTGYTNVGDDRKRAVVEQVNQALAEEA